jgi:hypothetical protein
MAVGNLRGRGGEERPVNPPFREPGEAPGAPLPAAEAHPASIAVDDDGHEEPGREPDPPPPPEVDSEGRPLPVHVAYARSDSDPEVVAAPPARSVPRPSRSPFWAAVRSHLLLFAIVLAVAALAGTAYWGLRVHQRIPAGTLERAIAGRENASAVRCVEQQSNGAVWACGLVYQAASVCLIADVNPVGDWNTKDGPGLCDGRPQLAAILPDPITAAGLAADMASQQAFPGARCAKVPTKKVRWACLQPGGSCKLVRVAPWRSLAAEASDVCEHMPAFKKHHGKA